MYSYYNINLNLLGNVSSQELSLKSFFKTNNWYRRYKYKKVEMADICLLNDIEQTAFTQQLFMLKFLNKAH